MHTHTQLTLLLLEMHAENCAVDGRVVARRRAGGLTDCLLAMLHRAANESNMPEQRPERHIYGSDDLLERTNRMRSVTREHTGALSAGVPYGQCIPLQQATCSPNISHIFKNRSFELMQHTMPRETVSNETAAFRNVRITTECGIVRMPLWPRRSGGRAYHCWMVRLIRVG